MQGGLGAKGFCSIPPHAEKAKFDLQVHVEPLIATYGTIGVAETDS
jgi:hypothetical protein